MNQNLIFKYFELIEDDFDCGVIKFSSTALKLITLVL